MTVFGNIITSLSWFGVGLHSYGFMDQAFGMLLAFIIRQFTIMGVGIVPQKYWRGIQAREKPTDAGQPKAVLARSAVMKE